MLDSQTDERVRKRFKQAKERAMDERLLEALVKLKRWSRDKQNATLSDAELITLTKIMNEARKIIKEFQQECTNRG